MTDVEQLVQLDPDTTRKLRRAELAKRLMIVVALATVGIIIAGFLFLGVSIRHTQIDGTPTGKRIVELSETIAQCTDPDGACYKRAQAASAAQTAAINEVTVYATLCARQGINTLAAMRGCIDHFVKDNPDGDDTPPITLPGVDTAVDG